MTRQKVLDRLRDQSAAARWPLLVMKKSPRKWVWCLLLWIAQVSREKTVFSNWLAGGGRRLLAIKGHAVLHQKPSCDWSLEVCHNHLYPPAMGGAHSQTLVCFQFLALFPVNEYTSFSFLVTRGFWGRRWPVWLRLWVFFGFRSMQLCSLKVVETTL